MKSHKDYRNREFNLTEELRSFNIQRFAKIGPAIRVIYDGKPIVITYNIDDLDKMMHDFRMKADRIIVVSNDIDKSEIIDKLISHMTNELLDYYENEGSNNGSASSNNDTGEAGQSQQQQHGNNNHNFKTEIMKYTQHKTEERLVQLWETVKVGGKPYLVAYNYLENKLALTEEIFEENRILLPETENGTTAYSFRDTDELELIIKIAKLQTLGTLFKKVKHYVSLFFDTDSEAYVNLITADIIYTYFQDRIGKTHYLFLYGEPGTGKGAVLECFNQLGYRSVEITDATAATIYRVLGNVEKGQVIMIIDEANRLEDNPFLLDVLKVGYKGEAKVPRVLEANSGAAKPVYFYAYCFKIIAAEKLPAHWKTGGFLSRCLIIHTSPGDPSCDIGDVVDNAGDPDNAKMMDEIANLRKLLFAYRLLHYSEPIHDFDIKGISGRDKEIIKPLLRLFKTHGDSQSLETIKETLHYFIQQRNEQKTDSFEAYIHVILGYLLQSKKEKELSFAEIWDHIKEQLRGEPVDAKPNTIETSLFGGVSKKQLAAVLRNLGGKRDRDSSGDKRIWKFDTKILDRYSKVFKGTPDTIEIVEQETLESATTASNHTAGFRLFDDNGGQVRGGEELLSSDTSDTSDTSLENGAETKQVLPSENRTKSGVENEGITTKNTINNDNLDNKKISTSQLSSNNLSDVSEVSELSQQAGKMTSTEAV